MKVLRRGRSTLLLSLALFSAVNLLSFSLFWSLWYRQRTMASQWAVSEGHARGESCPTSTALGMPHLPLDSKTTTVVSPAIIGRNDPDSSMEHLFHHFRELLFRRRVATKRTHAIRAPRLESLWNVWAVNYTIDKPRTCDRNAAELASIVMVVSSPTNVAQRDGIRETWGEMLKRGATRILFFVGRSSDLGVETSLLAEDRVHEDVVQADFTDSYANLTLKSVLLLRWVSTRCPFALSVFKVDDDVFINAVNFRQLVESKSIGGRRVLGHLAHRWKPIRDRSSHYYVSDRVWTSTIYPDFVTGPAYVITRDAVVAILDQLHSVPFFFLEDVYVTGLCAERAGVQRMNHRGFFNRKLPINPCLYHKLVTVHHLVTDEMRGAQDILDRHLGNDSSCYEIRCTADWLGVCLAKGRVPRDYFVKQSLR